MSKIQNLWWVAIFFLIISVASDIFNINKYYRALNGLEKFQYSYLVINEDELLKIVSTYKNEETFCAEKNSFLCEHIWPYLTYASYFEGLYMFNNSLGTISKEFFSLYPNLTCLYLWHNIILEIEEGAFSNLKNLSVLNLKNFGRQELAQNIFADLHLLRYLNLPNTLFELPANFVDNNVKLTTLNLNGNRITKLPRNFFINNKDLEEINLSDNYLGSVPENMLNGLQKLKHLDLRHNRLFDLPNNLFDSCHNLTILHLGNNFMDKINWSIFAGLDFLEDLDLSENGISNIPIDPLMIFKSVEKINLSINEISNSNSNQLIFQNLFNIFPKLNSLNLTHNYLRRPQNLIDIFINHLRQMEDLNSTNYLPTKNNLSEMKHFFLGLSENRISGIDLHNYTESSYHIWNLDIKKHLFSCNCNLYDVLRYSNDKVNTSLRINITFSYCKGSEKYKKVKLKTLNYQHYECRPSVNEIAEASKCPKNCDLQKRLWDKMIVLDCSNQNYFTPPETLCFFKSPEYMIELNLTRNRIKDFPNFQHTDYKKVVNLILSYNKISTIPQDILLNHRLKLLKLDNNQLKVLSAHIVREISLFVESIELGNNPWECDCDVLDFHELLLTKNVIKDGDKIICESSKTLLRNVIFREICSYYNFYYISAALIFSIFLIISFAHHFKNDIKIWLYAHNLCLCLVTEEELDKDKLYDIFISYSHKDEEFVIDQLVANLEEGPKSFKLCLHFRDWTAGEYIPTQIENSIKNSKRTIIVLSRNYIESDWGRLEFKTAHTEALDEGRVRLIVILYGDIGPIDDLDPDLKSYLKMTTFVKWGDPWFWDKLRYALPHKNFQISENCVSRRQTEVCFNRNEVDHLSGFNLLDENVESRL